jgi:hypothetical protein
MIQPINFRRGKQTLDALLVYNFETVSDIIVVVPGVASGVGEIVFFQKFPNIWSTNELPVYNEELYSAITAQLENIFRTLHYSFRILSRRPQNFC